MSLCINPNCPNPHNRDTILFCQGCGSELLLEGRYRATQQLGGGGFGKTYEVRDRYGSLKVLKVLIENNPKHIQLFRREAQVLLHLNHPGIPTVEADAYFTYSPATGRELLHCLVMEKIEGLNLRQYLEQRGKPIEEKRAIEWLQQLVDILQAVHSCNFFHRDIKPSNLMLKADGQIVLIDFGTARQATGTFVNKQATGQVTGIISAGGYTPPEQLMGQAVPQSDFFALGRTFVYLLTRIDPDKLCNPDTDTLDWNDAAGSLSGELSNLLDRMMADHPDQRPQTAEEIRSELLQIEQALYPEHRPASTPVPPAATLDIKSYQFPTQTESITQKPAEISRQSNPISPSQADAGLESEFIMRCQQELAEAIGPIAAIVCRRTLVETPGLSASELVETLARKIPNRQQAQEFRRRLLF